MKKTRRLLLFAARGQTCGFFYCDRKDKKAGEIMRGYRQENTAKPRRFLTIAPSRYFFIGLT